MTHDRPKKRLATRFMMLHGRPREKKMAWDDEMGRRKIPIKLLTENNERDKPEVIRAWLFIVTLLISIAIAVWAVWRTG